MFFVVVISNYFFLSEQNVTKLFMFLKLTTATFEFHYGLFVSDFPLTCTLIIVYIVKIYNKIR